MQQRYKEPRPKRAATSGKQADTRILCGPRTNLPAGDSEAHRRVFREDSKNECKDVLEEPTTAQAKEKTTSSLRARDVEAPATLEILRAPPGKEEIAVCLRLIGTSSLKGGANWHVC
jgi:hypothetical protein